MNNNIQQLINDREDLKKITHENCPLCKKKKDLCNVFRSITTNVRVDDNTIVIDNDSEIEEVERSLIYIPISFCPLCGRRLK